VTLGEKNWLLLIPGKLRILKSPSHPQDSIGIDEGGQELHFCGDRDLATAAVKFFSKGFLLDQRKVWCHHPDNQRYAGIIRGKKYYLGNILTPKLHGNLIRGMIGPFDIVQNSGRFQPIRLDQLLN